jgi:hypothetical protein
VRQRTHSVVPVLCGPSQVRPQHPYDSALTLRHNCCLMSRLMQSEIHMSIGAGIPATIFIIALILWWLRNLARVLPMLHRYDIASCVLPGRVALAQTS